MYSIITSEKDTAGINIRNQLKESDNYELLHIEDDSLYAEVQQAKGDIIIFATRHASEQQKPCLCVHTPGNWDKAEFGGEDKKLCTSFANLQTQAYLELKKKNTLDFEVTMEATHHGPLISKPCIFIEIGSSENEWENEEAGRIIAETIHAITTEPLPEKKAIVGIGGPHYCNNFNKLAESDYAIGHVCPKYMLDKLTPELLKQAIEKTYEDSPLIALDWKGLGPYKKNVTEIIQYLGLEYKKIKELLSL